MGTSHHPWLVVLLGGLLLSSAVLVSLLRSPPCFSSDLVQVIRVESGELYSCRLHRKASYDEWASEVLPQVSARLKKLERTVQELNVVPSASGGETPAKGSVNEISLRRDELTGTDQLEIQLLNKILWRSKPSFEQELLTQLLIERWITNQPVRAANVSFESRTWLSILHSTFLDMNLRERNEFVVDWRARLSRPQGPQGGGQVSGPPRSVTDRPLTAPNSTWLLAPKIKQKAEALGYSPESREWNVAYAVDVEENLENSLAREFGQRHITSMTPGKAQLPFLAAPVQRTELAKLHVGKLMLIRCQLPDLPELDLLGFQFEHLILVKHCGKISPDFVLRALKSTTDFASHYVQTPFIHFHWPSLRLVLSRSGVHPRTVGGLFEATSVRNFTKVGLLKNLSLDHELGTGRWVGTVEPVVMYRL
ncbi:MAG: hypothetical protein C5B49_09895 [Bdellovibrio sp.]|nr:MAG: hypothetical protein C5B49_09895 [Bdellovibrio sp.]